jgi:uncharacterized protein YciI/ketosteroid isomerase-like protein
MSSAGKQTEPRAMPKMPFDAGPLKTYAFVYGTGPQWIAGRPVTEQDLGTHRAYIAELYTRGRVLCGGPFLDDAGGGFAVVRARDHDEASAMLSADPAIAEGIMTGTVRRWHAAFNEAEDSRAAQAQTQANKRAVEALFAAVDRSDGEGVRAAYDDNVAIHEAASLPYGGDYRGREGALRHGHGFRAAWKRFQPHDTRGLDPLIIADCDYAAVLWRHRLENAETGERLDLPAVSVYRMENAKVADSRMFHFDTAALLRFLERNAERSGAQVPRSIR